MFSFLFFGRKRRNKSKSRFLNESKISYGSTSFLDFDDNAISKLNGSNILQPSPTRAQLATRRRTITIERDEKDERGFLDRAFENAAAIDEDPILDQN